MKTWVAALLVLSVTYVTGVPAVGGWSEVIKPPFAIDNHLVRILPDLAKDIRAQIVAKVPKDKEVETAPIYLEAYKQQVVAGSRYLVGTQVNKLKFNVHLLEPVGKGAVVEKVVGPLVDGSPDLLS